MMNLIFYVSLISLVIAIVFKANTMNHETNNFIKAAVLLFAIGSSGAIVLSLDAHLSTDIQAIVSLNALASALWLFMDGMNSWVHK